MSTILFVSHDAYRGGATLVLLHFLRWLRTHTSHSFEVLVRQDAGSLLPEFEAVAPVTLLHPRPSRAGRLGRRALGAFVPARRDRTDRGRRRWARRKADIGLVYSNTATNAEALEVLAPLGCPVISHVHELDYWIRHRAGVETFRTVQRYTTHYVAASEAVRRMLVAQHGIPEDRIDLVHSFIPARGLDADLRAARRRIRAELGIPPEAVVVAGSGVMEWWKGPDLFVQLAGSVSRLRPRVPVHFLWVGAEPDARGRAELWHDVTALGLGERVAFVGLRPNPLDYFAASDIFALVSRVDAFPLVVLEAAALGRPVLCFEGAGGAREFVEEDCGFVVPYLDVAALAARVRQLAESAELRQHLGERAARKVRERHDVGVAAPRLLAIVERFLGAAARPGDTVGATAGPGWRPVLVPAATGGGAG